MSNTDMQKTNSTILDAIMNGRSFFFQQFLKHPLQIGSVIPSSRFLERRVVDAAKVDSARTIIELGPGIGGITKAILSSMDSKARLLSIEINPDFHAYIKNIQDDRLIAHLGDARQLKEIISEYRLGAPDVVISGIPFSTMSERCGSQIVDSIFRCLEPGGRFIAYQLSKRIITLCKPVMGQGHVELELLNIPPMRVCCWMKRNGDGSKRQGA